MVPRMAIAKIALHSASPSLSAAARLPMEQQLERFAALDKQVDRSDRRKDDLSQVLPLLPFKMAQMCSNRLRGQALLATAEAAVCDQQKVCPICIVACDAFYFAFGLLYLGPPTKFSKNKRRIRHWGVRDGEGNDSRSKSSVNQPARFFSIPSDGDRLATECVSAARQFHLNSFSETTS